MRLCGISIARLNWRGTLLKRTSIVVSPFVKMVKSQNAFPTTSGPSSSIRWTSTHGTILPGFSQRVRKTNSATVSGPCNSRQPRANERATRPGIASALWRPLMPNRGILNQPAISLKKSWTWHPKPTQRPVILDSNHTRPKRPGEKIIRWRLIVIRKGFVWMLVSQSFRNLLDSASSSSWEELR